MRLRRLRVNNYCQHAGQHEWFFSGNTIGIIGRNGTGKSNLVNAVQDGVTGEFHKKRQKIISYGQKDGDFELDFDAIDGTRLRVWRSLRKSAATLQVLDVQGNVVEDVANTVSGTNAALKGYIPIDPSVLKHIVFAGQEDITTLLFKKSATKERLAQAFFGVERARQIEKILGEILSGLPGYDDTIGTMLDDNEVQLRSLMEQEEELERRAVGPMLTSEQVGTYRGWLSDYSERLNTSSRRILLQQGVSEINTYINECEKKVKAERDLIEGFSATAVQDRIDTAKADIEINNQIDRAHATIASWKATVEQAQRHDELKEELGDVTLEHAGVLTRTGELGATEKAALGVLVKLEAGESTHCPICDHEVTVADLVNYRERLNATRGLIKICCDAEKRLWARHEELMQSLRALQADASAAEARIADAELELARLGPKREVPRLQPLMDALKLIQDAEREIARLTQEIQVKQAEQLPSVKAIEEIDAAPEADCITPEQRLEAVAALNAHEVALEAQAAKDQELATLRGQIQVVRDQIDRLEVAHNRQHQIQQRRNKIARVRQIFHYSGAPQAVVHSRLLSIQSRINHYLDLLSTPYRVSVEEGLNFLCRFAEKEVDSTELSGGEKVDLSVAFRLAACESFCSNIGFIALDEPTTWLDEETKHEMVNVLERLNELGRSDNFQFLMPTHERMLLEHFDQVIEL